MDKNMACIIQNDNMPVKLIRKSMSAFFSFSKLWSSGKCY